MVEFFYTRNNRPRTFSYSFGTSDIVDYETTFNDKGETIIVEVGRKDGNKMVQVGADYCDIKTIVQRYRAGDVDAINRVQGAYFDSTNLPTNVHEGHRFVKQIEKNFDNLPLDIKDKFGNNFNVFMKEVSKMTPDEYLIKCNLKTINESIIEKEVAKDGELNG